jgi:hypothetical protein
VQNLDSMQNLNGKRQCYDDVQLALAAAQRQVADCMAELLLSRIFTHPKQDFGTEVARVYRALEEVRRSFSAQIFRNLNELTQMEDAANTDRRSLLDGIESAKRALSELDIALSKALQPINTLGIPKEIVTAARKAHILIEGVRMQLQKMKSLP